MARPIIATKLYVPKRRRGLVARPRLHERLRVTDDVRLVLVSAPAGFGKTTLLAGWFDDRSETGPGVAWISLDPTDSEPSVFWSCVAAALEAIGALGPTVQELLGTSPFPTELMIATLVNDLAASPDDVWLVLDDFHTVDSRDIVQAVAVLVDRLPHHVHLVISTRVDPDLPLSRWRVRGDLVEIRAADLRFTVDEAAEYLNDMAGLGLAQEQVAALDERTEGWVAALQLAALSIRGHEDVGGFISRFAGDDRYIVDYLVEEVLQRQPDHVRVFLSQSSVLDRLSGPLCDAVTGGEDGREMLELLERANLFVVSLDDRREWFRYHHLFADALRARALNDQPETVALNHLRASEWYERNSLADEAVRHATAAADFDRATRLIEQAVLTLVGAGVLPGALVPMIRRYQHDRPLAAWLEPLPIDAVRRSPVVSVCYGWMLMVSGRLDEVEPWFDHAEQTLILAENSAASSPETADLRWLPATIAVFRAALAQARGDLLEVSEHGQRALELASPDDHLSRGGAAGFIALASWLKGDVTTALATFTQAVRSVRAAGNLTDELTSIVVLGDMWLASGRPQEARRLLQDALALAAVNSHATRGTADLHVALSEIDLEAGHLEAAKRHLESAAAADARAPMGENRFRLFVVMAKIAAAEGDLQRAEVELDRAEHLHHLGFMPEMRPIPAIRARLWIAQGRLAEAAEWARTVGVTATDEVNHLREFDLLTLSRLLIAQHRVQQDLDSADRALVLLGRLHEVAESSARWRSVVETHVLSAVALDGQGHQSAAMVSLERAWGDEVEPGVYVRLFLDEGAPMLELLRSATRSSTGSARAQRLLDLHASSVRMDATVPVPHRSASANRPGTMVDPLSERELHVLRLLASDLSGPQIASELYVSLNTLRTHTKRIFTKLDVSSRRAAVSRARELGVL